jgi:hypothetical protein
MIFDWGKRLTQFVIFVFYKTSLRSTKSNTHLLPTTRTDTQLKPRLYLSSSSRRVHTQVSRRPLSCSIGTLASPRFAALSSRSFFRTKKTFNMNLKLSLIAVASFALVLLTLAPTAHGAALVPMTEATTATGTTKLTTTITVDEYTLTLTAPTAITYKVRVFWFFFVESAC